MSTIDYTEAAGFGMTTGERMRSLLTDRAAVRRAFDTLVTSPRAGWSYLAGKAQALGLDRAFGFARSKATWVLGLARTAGPGNVAVLALTTPQGNAAVDVVLRRTTRAAGWALRLLLVPFAVIANHTGAPGRTLSLRVQVLAKVVADKTKAAYLDGSCWLADRHDHPVVSLARSLAAWSIVRRIARRFVPDPRLRAAVYLVSYFTVPYVGDAPVTALETGTRALEGTAKALHRAADATEEAAETQETPETATEPLKAAQAPVQAQSWDSLDGYTPAAHPLAISVTRKGNVKEKVLVHRQADGTSVFAFGKTLYVGRMPADVIDAEVKVAEAIAAAESTSNGAAPANRAGRRAEVRAQKRS